MEHVDESVWVKIEALRSLSDPDRGATEHEIRTATAKLQSLLTKHNLDMASVRRPGRSSTITHQDFEPDHRQELWHLRLIQSLAEFNFCIVLKFDEVMTIVGEPHNVRVVWDLYMMLVPKIQVMGTTALESEQEKPEPIIGGLWEYYEYSDRDASRKMAHRNPKAWVNSYLIGLVTGIREQLESQRTVDRATDEKRTMSESRALMRVMEKETQDYVDEHFLFEKTPLSVTADEKVVWNQGRTAGRNLDLDKKEELTQ